jgi:hypothetical protein
MTDVIVFNTKPAPNRYEIRCTGFIATNNLGVPGPVGKYGMTIRRIKEPQDVQGNQVGERQPIDDVVIPDLAVVAGEHYTLNDGTTLTVAQILEAVNAFTDAHKAENANSAVNS